MLWGALHCHHWRDLPVATASSKYSSAHSTSTHPSFWRHSCIVDVSDQGIPHGADVLCIVDIYNILLWTHWVLGALIPMATIKTVFRHLLGHKIIPG